MSARALPHETLTADGQRLNAHLEAEQALLGAILFDNETYNRITPKLDAAHFYDPIHGRIFAACAETIAAGRLADGVTLRERFAADGALREIGGASYLLTLLENAAKLTIHAQEYAELILELAQRRSLQVLFHDFEKRAASGEDSADIVIDAERCLADIADHGAPHSLWRPMGDIMARSISAARAGEALGLSTGLDALDQITGGLTRGSLWVIAGASSMGKSLVGQAIALSLAGDAHGVGYVHLEMGELSVGLRAATALAHDPANRSTHMTDANPTYLGARRRALSEWGWSRLDATANAHAALPLRVDARPHQTLSQIESGAKRLKRLMERAGCPLRALFIDHEGLIAAEKDRKSKWEEVSDRIVRLQGIAKKLDIAVVAMVQINREGASKDGSQRPNMGHLANSADIERCADVICLLYREAYFAQRKPDHDCTDDDYAKRRSNRLEIIVDKSRDGERKTVNAVLDVRTGYLAEAT